jgi:amidohydrolase
MHNMPGFPQGHLVLREGAAMASSDYATVTLTGVGGHGGLTHKAVDPIVAAASIVMALQTIVARNINPEEPAVITVGSIHAGEASNVIAETAELRGSIRSFSEEVRETLHRRIHEVATGIAAAMGATAEVQTIRGVDATVNAVAPTELVYDVAAEVLGAEKVDTTYRSTGGEDFSAVLNAVPGHFFFLGSRNRELGFHYPHHNPHFDIDESSLPQGVAILCEAALRSLKDS